MSTHRSSDRSGPRHLARAGEAGRPRQPHEWRGVTLLHRGTRLGVVSRVSCARCASGLVLHARGGVSGALEYAVPERSVTPLPGSPPHGAVDPELEFSAERIHSDGRVSLVPRGVGDAG